MNDARKTDSNVIPDIVDVVVRCRDEMPHTRRTLTALARQESPRARVLFIDSGSTDGSREAALEARVELLDWPPGTYMPGAVINAGMARTRSAVVAFINADAVPRGPDALRRLIAPLCGGGPAAAAYGRQVPRPGADVLTQLDHARAFPASGTLALRRGTFFSMAASAIRRDVWELLPFDEGLRYSEDVDWVRRAAALGWTTAYAPDAAFEHSHDYDVRGSFQRRRGEGAADTLIHRLGAPSWLSDLARPLAGSLARDALAGASSPRGVATRVAQATGYFAGRRRAARADACEGRA
ncbi:glycosyltransferase family 2 protein [Sorangium sp. So ce1335]|uniref:glycosyltransferase family 2 protein n=1 Tax=Sorangium sp. So ce1335 TaxID=3133335 RepID=UPI003F609BF3